MELTLMTVFMFICIGFMAYQVANRKLVEEVHLPSEIAGERVTGFKSLRIKNIFSGPIKFIEGLFIKYKIPLPMGNLNKRLIYANRIMTATQFLALKFLVAMALPLIIFFFFHIASTLLLIPMAIGFVLPEMWLNARIKKRSNLVLKDLPLVIDLLNICVGAGLDFMVAVNRVIQDFRPCLLIEELKGVAREIQMGSSRRDALKNMASHINNPEINSFVRTLLQADRIGTPISEALKMQSEEIRVRWFQRGEEMALKAPIKLLLPLMLFILPVVLIIVAGPILIQFTRGGSISF